MTLTTVGHDLHLEHGGLLLILPKDVFVEALKRGKAYKRAMARRAREAEMAARAQAKRERLGEG